MSIDTSDNSIEVKSSAKKILENNSDTNLILGSINEKDLDVTNTNYAGVVTGLKKDIKYKTNFFYGTQCYSYVLKADTRIFTSYESYTTDSYRLLEKNVAVINIPETFPSGYYCANGCGLFLYLKDGDTINSDLTKTYQNIDNGDGNEIINDGVTSYMKVDTSDFDTAVLKAKGYTDDEISEIINNETAANAAAGTDPDSIEDSYSEDSEPLESTNLDSTASAEKTYKGYSISNIYLPVKDEITITIEVSGIVSDSDHPSILLTGPDKKQTECSWQNNVATFELKDTIAGTYKLYMKDAKYRDTVMTVSVSKK